MTLEDKLRRAWPKFAIRTKQSLHVNGGRCWKAYAWTKNGGNGADMEMEGRIESWPKWPEPHRTKRAACEALGRELERIRKAVT